MNFYLVCSIDSNNVILIKLVNKIQIISVGFNNLTIAMIYAQVLGNLNIDFIHDIYNLFNEHTKNG